MSGSNSNWHGLVCVRLNGLLLRVLLNLYGFYGDDFTVECPTDSGKQMPCSKRRREDAIRAYADTIEKALLGDPFFLAPLKLHDLRWVCFDVGDDKYFMYQGICDTDFDKYTDDAVVLSSKSGLNAAFENLEGFPEEMLD
jgi:hypothetical protein